LPSINRTSRRLSARPRLLAPNFVAIVSTPSMLCEDLVTMQVDHARTKLWELGVTEADVIVRIHRGLLSGAAGVTAFEAKWLTVHSLDRSMLHDPVVPGHYGPLGDIDRRREALGRRVAAKDLENCLEDAVSILKSAMKAITRHHVWEQSELAVQAL
jgi:hypothetical protein